MDDSVVIYVFVLPTILPKKNHIGATVYVTVNAFLMKTSR